MKRATVRLNAHGQAKRLFRACPKGRVAESLSESFVGKLCRNRPFSTELRQSVSTKIDDKVGHESFGQALVRPHVVSQSHREYISHRLQTPHRCSGRSQALCRRRRERNGTQRYKCETG